MQTVNKSQLKQWLEEQEDMVLIDVLPKESFQKRHIPDAINIPVKENANFVKDVVQHVSLKDKRIVLYCMNTECPLSKEAAKKLESAGYTNVRVFEEGLEGWFGKSSQAAA